MAAPLFGSIGTALTGTAATCDIPVPASVATLDIIIAVIYSDDTTTTFATPDGSWTEAGSSPVSNSVGQSYTLHVFWKRATGGDSGVYSFTPSGSVERNAFALRYTGCVTTGNPFDAANSANNLEFSGPPAPTPAVSLTTTDVDRTLVWIATSWTGGNATVPAGYTQRATGLTGGSWVVADKAQASAGATGSVAGSWDQTTTALGAWLGALIPGGGAPPAAPPAAAVPVRIDSRQVGPQALRRRFRNPRPPRYASQPEFVRRDPATGNLIYKGARYRWAGSNAQLALSEDASNYGATVDIDSLHLLSHSEVDAVISASVSMNANVIRSFAALSVGKTNAIQPSLGGFNQAAFEPLDYAITQCAANGIKLILPLVDNYQYYFGGKYLYCIANGVTPANSSDCTEFFTNSAIIASFKAHISAVLGHINTYTGVAYRDEPAVLAWETGNELAVSTGWVYSAWTDTISRHIKLNEGARQLVFDGHYGIFTTDPTVDTTSLDLAYVDGYSNHAYDNFRTPTVMVSEATTVHGHGKCYYVGEWTWTDSGVSPQPTWVEADMISAIEGSTYVDGDNFYALLPKLTTHGDGFSLHWPGDDSNMITRATRLANHAAVFNPPTAVAARAWNGTSWVAAPAARTWNGTSWVVAPAYQVLV